MGKQQIFLVREHNASLTLQLLSISSPHIIPPRSVQWQALAEKFQQLLTFSTRLEALDNLVISTLLSISVKLCATSTSLLHHVRMKSSNPEERRVAETLVIEQNSECHLLVPENNNEIWKRQNNPDQLYVMLSFGHTIRKTTGKSSR